MTDTHILLCSDLDRTLLPNGPQEESPRAREMLRRLAARSEVCLAYVSGRHRQLLQEAIAAYDLPVPDYAIGDVGTTIYRIEDGVWRHWQAWEDEIAPDWQEYTHERLAELFAGVEGLRLQEPEKQNRFKLSYYAAEDADAAELKAHMQAMLDERDVRAGIIWSVDEVNHVGLLDVLPASATKYHAVRFLMLQRGYGERETLFAGDSGNDLPVLTSGLQSVLVGNAMDAVREEALRAVRDRGTADSLYLARGGFLGMNGNYAAGVLEGAAHFFPEVRDWLV